jgi:hypothetical protein
MFVAKQEVDGFVPAPSGMMEYWNTGKMGFEIRQILTNDTIRPGDRTYKKSCPFENPLFHRSIILFN